MTASETLTLVTYWNEEPSSGSKTSSERKCKKKYKTVLPVKNRKNSTTVAELSTNEEHGFSSVPSQSSSKNSTLNDTPSTGNSPYSEYKEPRLETIEIFDVIKIESDD